MSGVVKLYVGDVIRTRKKHPCGGDVWVIERVGADVGMTCRTCGRYVLMDRVKLERRIREFLERGSEEAPLLPPLLPPRPIRYPEPARRGRKTVSPEAPPRPRRRIVRRALQPEWASRSES
ncbi:MAG: DUF951 domain-containing protein [Armatimonadota bacterium]|nr:DUF951 domain-containing protein [Armatimonadota bacterium]MDR7569154.1 DUF951 domain-containing protein [Armatimonadota bacterium]MDR7613400.1 DUF951 domain-containing protein [Armatimonadota bacterium]